MYRCVFESTVVHPSVPVGQQTTDRKLNNRQPGITQLEQPCDLNEPICLADNQPDIVLVTIIKAHGELQSGIKRWHWTIHSIAAN